MVTEQLQACVQASQRAQGGGEERLVYLSRSGHRVDAVAAFLLGDWHLCPSFCFLCFSIPNLLLLVCLLLVSPSSEPTFEFPCSSCAEVVACPDHVGSMCVMRRVERGEQGEHFGRVAAAAEDDEEVGGRPALTGRGAAVVEGREDVD